MIFMLSSQPVFLIILFVCAALCLRCLFQDAISRDSLSTLSLTNMILCVLCFFAWGVTIAFLLVFFLALIVLLINFRCVLRFTAQLKHGRFSLGFAVMSLVTLPFVIAAAALLVYERPVRLDTSGITRETAMFTGSFTSGFVEHGAFQPLNAMVTSFTPRGMNGAVPLVLFVSPDEASINDYEPFLSLLCKEGYEIKAGEFWAADNRRFDSLLDARPLKKFAARLDTMVYKTQASAASRAAKGYAALIELYGKQAAESRRAVYLLADGNYAAAQRTAESFSFAVPVAVTPGPLAGFGCIEQTEPLLALILGFSRDTEFIQPRRALAEWKAKTSAFSGE
jgi:hypothetical protein